MHTSTHSSKITWSCSNMQIINQLGILTLFQQISNYYILITVVCASLALFPKCIKCY